VADGLPTLPRRAWLVLTLMSAVVLVYFVSAVWGHHAVDLLGVIIATAGLVAMVATWFLIRKIFYRKNASVGSSDRLLNPALRANNTVTPSWSVVRLITVFGVLIVVGAASFGHTAAAEHMAALVLSMLGLRAFAVWMQHRRGA